MIKEFFIFIIDLYRKYISPVKSTKCPYYPTCSTYGREAVQKFGALKGGFLAFFRIIRCNPFSKGGYDPLRDNFKDNIFVKRKYHDKNKMRYIPNGTAKGGRNQF